MVLRLRGQRHPVSSVIRPDRGHRDVRYPSVEVDPSGDEHQSLLVSATGPAGAHLAVTYAYTQDEPYALSSPRPSRSTTPNGDPIGETRTFDIDPDVPSIDLDNFSHNYLGYPNYSTPDPGDPGADQLYESQDENYLYSTMISTPSSATVSTYDSAHRLVSRSVLGVFNNGAPTVPVTTQTAAFPDLAAINNQPGNYAKPTSTTVQYRSRSGPNGFIQVRDADARTVKTSTTYDDSGRIKTTTDELDTTTTYTYDPTFGLPTSVVVTAPDGTVQSTTNTLTDDGKSILNSMVAIGDDGPSVSARSVTTYTFDDFGEPRTRTVTWAPGAAPDGDGGGPASATTTYASTIDGSTRTMMITYAAGTSAA